MNIFTLRTIAVFSLAGVLFVSGIVSAQGIDSYLNDKLDTAVRIEIQAPESVTKNQSWLGRLGLLLGIRQTKRYTPPVGTQLTVQASAYASSPYQTDSTPCITAAGTRVRPGVVATNFLPLGAILDINGQEFIVEDRMNSRYDGYYMDVWFPSTSSALEFGRKKLNITIKAYGEPGQTIRAEENEKKDSNQKDASAEEDDTTKPSWWDSVKSQLATIGSLLGARGTGNPDQYDVDCLKE